MPRENRKKEVAPEEPLESHISTHIWRSMRLAYLVLLIKRVFVQKPLAVQDLAAEQLPTLTSAGQLSVFEVRPNDQLGSCSNS